MSDNPVRMRSPLVFVAVVLVLAVGVFAAAYAGGSALSRAPEARAAKATTLAVGGSVPALRTPTATPSPTPTATPKPRKQRPRKKPRTTTSAAATVPQPTVVPQRTVVPRATSVAPRRQSTPQPPARQKPKPDAVIIED
jgi:hypothetical protein